MSDVLQDAEAIQQRAADFRNEGQTVVTIPQDAYDQLAPRLLLIGEYEKILPELIKEIKRLQEQLAKWKQTAIEDRTNLLMLKDAQKGTNLLIKKLAIVAKKDEYRLQAAKELDLEQEAEDDERLKVLQDYVKRLEAGYLESEKDRRKHLSDGWRDPDAPELTWERAGQEAQAALAKIREGACQK